MSGNERQAADPGKPARFPWFRLVAAMTLVGGIGCAGVCVLGPRLSAQPAADWQATAVWAFLLVGVTYLATVAAFTRAAPFGITALTWAFFAAMAVRMVACLGIAGITVRMGWFPSRPMAVSLAAAYLPLLVIEVLGVTRFMRTATPDAGPGVEPEAIS